MFSKNQIELARVAITADGETKAKWVSLATAIKPVFVNEKAYTKAKPAVIAELIRPHVPDAAAIEKANAALPHKRSEAYTAACEADPNYAAQFEAIRKADASQRAKCNEYFNRLGGYIFRETLTDDEKKAKKAKDAKKAKTPKATAARIQKKAAELLAMIQKDERPLYRHADATRIATSLVAALTPVDMSPSLNAEKGSGQRRTK